MGKGKVLGALFLTGLSFAGGYKIPEQSVRSTATSGAYFSSALSADSAYYNPANMSFLKGKWGMEIGLRYIVLPNIDFSGRVIDPATKQPVRFSASSNKEEFIIPYFHYVSPAKGRVRFGLSFTTPAGLAKGWENSPAQAFAKNFLLEVYELSFSASYLVTKNFSVGGGIRGVYARGNVEFSHPSGAYVNVMKGNTDIKPGAFFSVSFRPSENLILSALYRTEVNLDIEGNASGYLYIPQQNRIYRFSTDGNVEIPLPAELRVGASYKFGNTTFEFTYDRTFWSSYEKLDFNFEDRTVESAFGEAREKDWKDTNTYRFAVYHEFRKKYLLMGGIAYDETPVPERTLGFELPDSNGWIFSLGGIYRPEPAVEFGIAYLLFIKEERNVNNNIYGIEGEFKDISAHMLTLSAGIRF